MNTFLMISRFMNKTFALWVVVFGALGFVFPQVFKPVGAYVSILLGVVMFGMGLTLTTADFREIFRRPKDVAVGILAQFLIMPLAAFVLCKAFDLPPDLAVGLMLLGCVPGGTASNVVTFLARGDVALSVTVTSWHDAACACRDPGFDVCLCESVALDRSDGNVYVDRSGDPCSDRRRRDRAQNLRR